MIDDPVAYSSSISAQPNSCDVQSTTSSPSLDRCTPASAAAKQNSAAKSRSDTASMEFGAGPSNPSSAATASGSIGSDEPASAPEPSGEIAARLSQSRSRATSRANACTCASNWCASRTGCACCVCVSPGAGVGGSAARWCWAWSMSAVCSSISRATTCLAWSRRYRRRSVATWSLRDRPARSLPPREPMRSSSPRSSAVCTSSSATVGRKAPLWQSRSRPSSALSSLASSPLSSSPALCSTRACAFDASRSYRASRQSNWTLTDSRASVSAGPDSNRPPHSRTGPVASAPTASSYVVRSACTHKLPSLELVLAHDLHTSGGSLAVAVRGDLAWQAPELDEALRELLVKEVAGVVSGQAVVVERERAPAAGNDGLPSLELDPDLAGHVLRRLDHESLKGLPERGEPQAVVGEFGPALTGRALESRQVAL